MRNMNIVEKINELKNEEISKEISKKIKEFEEVGQKTTNDIFVELCFCLMTANFSAKRALEIQEKIGDGFYKWPLEKLTIKLREYGHRFPNVRANYIFLARKHKINLVRKLSAADSEEAKREWLVQNIKGIGYKEASHFLRNIGYKNLAIVDFHILDLLINKKMDRPRRLSRETYLNVEKTLQKLADLVSLNLAELDLYLWYIETGKIYK